MSLNTDIPLWNKDIQKSFVQSQNKLKLEVLLRPPLGQAVVEVLDAPPGSLLKALKPLYGVPQSPGHWWSTIRNQHFDTLKMTYSATDPVCFSKLMAIPLVVPQKLWLKT